MSILDSARCARRLSPKPPLEKTLKTDTVSIVFTHLKLQLTEATITWCEAVQRASPHNARYFNGQTVLVKKILKNIKKKGHYSVISAFLSVHTNES